jgi:hypothetical protein
VHVAKSVALLALRYSWPTDNKRHVHAVLVEALLSHQAMLSHGQAIVSGKDNDRIFSVPRLLECFQHPTNLRINMRNHSIIIRYMPAHLFRRPRPSRQFFIANSHLTIIKRMLRHKILRQRELRRVIHIVIFLRRRPRVMRCRIRDIRKERLVLFVALQKLYRRITEQFTRMFSFPAVSCFLGVLPGSVEVIYRYLIMVTHPSEEYVCAPRERPGERCFPVMPLACPESNITGLPQHLRQHALFRRNRTALVHQIKQVLSR